MFSLWNCSSPPFHEHEKYDGVFAMFRVWEDETRTVGGALFRGSWLFENRNWRAISKLQAKELEVFILTTGCYRIKPIFWGTEMFPQHNASALEKLR